MNPFSAEKREMYHSWNGELNRSASNSDPNLGHSVSESVETLVAGGDQEELRFSAPYASPYRQLRRLAVDDTLSEFDEVDALHGEEVTPIPGASAIAMATRDQQRSAFNFSDTTNHAEAMLASAAQAQQESLFTDLVVHVGNSQFDCHRLILASCSPYFRNLLLGHNVGNGAKIKRKIGEGRKIIELLRIKPDVFQVVLSYMYSGEINAGSPEMMQDVFKLANRFLMPKLKTAAAEYLYNCLDVANCFTILQLAKDHSSDILYEKAERFVLENFEDSCMEEGFLNLSMDTLKKLLASPVVNVAEEESVFDAAMRWVKHKPSERIEHLAGVMAHIKFSQMLPQTLLGLMNDKNLDNNKECRAFLKRALDYLHSGKQHGQMMSEWIIPRASTGVQESIICLPGVGNTPEENINVIAYNDSPTSSSTTLFGSRDSLTQPAKWEYLTPLTVNPGYHYAATVFENNIYISGGELTPATVWKFDSTFRQWLPCADMKHGRVCHALCVAGGNIYSLGGRSKNPPGTVGSNVTDGKVIDSIEKYAVQVNSWKTVGKLVTPVHSMAYASHKEKIYLFGGRDANDMPTDSVQRFRCNGNYLKTITTLPHKAAFIRAETLNGVIYVLLNDMLLSFCVEKETFLELTRLDTPLVAPGLTHYQGHLVICGGLTELSPGARMAIDDVRAYDPQKRAWVTGEEEERSVVFPKKMPVALSYLSAVTVHRPINQQGQRTLCRQNESIRKREGASEC